MPNIDQTNRVFIDENHNRPQSASRKTIDVLILDGNGKPFLATIAIGIDYGAESYPHNNKPFIRIEHSEGTRFNIETTEDYVTCRYSE